MRLKSVIMHMKWNQCDVLNGRMALTIKGNLSRSDTRLRLPCLPLKSWNQ
jgi:hypothetical protein